MASESTYSSNQLYHKYKRKLNFWSLIIEIFLRHILLNIKGEKHIHFLIMKTAIHKLYHKVMQVASMFPLEKQKIKYS